MSHQRQVKMKRQRLAPRKKALSEKQGKKRLTGEDADIDVKTEEHDTNEPNLPAVPRNKPVNDEDLTPRDYIRQLSLEILCKILSYLPLKDVVRLARLSWRMHEAITMHLRLLREIDFTEGEIYGWMCPGFTDSTFATFLRRCPEVVNIYGLHMKNISKRRHRGSEQLSIPGVIAALSSCVNLFGIETSDIFLLEAITNYLPSVHILHHFKNRNGSFPILQKNRFDLHRNPRITSLNLVGVVIPELPRMDFLKFLQLKWVKLTDPHPFKDFGVPLLQTFVMNNCAGPVNALKYVPLITGLAGARSLKRMELVRVPFLGGLVQHVVEDSWRMQGFRQLHKVVFGTCKHALEVDLGYLVITCANKLEELSVQPSLTKDSFFASLTLADVNFPQFETLNLGFVDDFPEHGTFTNERLTRHGLADVNESPAMITDIGMKAVGQVFLNVKTLSVYNCPHLLYSTAWFTQGVQSWHRLKELHLRRCHALRLDDFCRMIPQLISLESLCLEQMFREPPKGCSRVGLSAGTGLGVSSALVQNSTNDLPNQGQGNNAPVVPANIPVNDAAVPVPPPNQNDNMDDAGDSESDDDSPEDNMPSNSASSSQGKAHARDSDKNGSCKVNEDEPRNNVGDVESERPTCCCNNKSSSDSGPSTSKGSSCERGQSAKASPKGEDGKRTRGKRTRQSHGSSTNVQSRLSVDEPSDIINHEASPTKRSRRLSRGRDESEQSNSQPQSKESKSPLYKGKGKSLRGRKKGLVKRSRQGEGSSISNRSQSCQAVSEEIRETTKKANDSEIMTNEDVATKKNTSVDEAKGSVHPKPGVISNQSTRITDGGDADQVESGHTHVLDKPTCSRATQTGNLSGYPESNNDTCRLQKPNMCDQSTSTSDPVIEEDHIQILKIQSATLLHLSIRQVGVTNLTVTDCPKLQLLVGSACRVLKKVCIKNVPQLARINFSQCKKLDHEWLVDQACQEPPARNRLIILRPMQSYDPLSLQKQMFKSAKYDYHMCLVHDNSMEPEQTKYNRQRANFILDTMSGLYFTVLSADRLQKACRKQQFREEFPWGRNVYKLRGKCVGVDNWWEIVTDMPWLRSLAAHTEETPEPCDKENKGGICHIKSCAGLVDMKMLEDEIAEAVENGEEIYPNSTLVYVNTCDLYGPPVKDMYF